MVPTLDADSEGVLPGNTIGGEDALLTPVEEGVTPPAELLTPAVLLGWLETLADVVGDAFAVGEAGLGVPAEKVASILVEAALVGDPPGVGDGGGDAPSDSAGDPVTKGDDDGDPDTLGSGDAAIVPVPASAVLALGVFVSAPGVNDAETEGEPDEVNVALGDVTTAVDDGVGE